MSCLQQINCNQRYTWRQGTIEPSHPQDHHARSGPAKETSKFSFLTHSVDGTRLIQGCRGST